MQKQINIYLLHMVTGLSLVFASCGKSNDAKPTDPGKPAALNVTVSTFAGNGISGDQDGSGDVIEFSSPKGLAMDSKGNVFVMDTYFNKLRKITPDGVTSTVLPYSVGIGICTDESDALYIGAPQNKVINKVLANGTLVVKLAPDGITTLVWGHAADLSSPYGVAFDKNADRLYVTDSASNTIDLVNSQGISSPFAKCGNDKNWGIAVDNKGNVFVGAAAVIYKITPVGVVSVYAGSGLTGQADGPVAKASFHDVKGITVDKNNNLYISDAGNNKIRLITTDGLVTTIAGTGATGFADGAGDNAKFATPGGIVANSDGTILYVADTDNNRIRKITLTR